MFSSLKKISLPLIVTLVTATLGSLAQAQVWLSPALSYTQTSDNPGSGETTVTSTFVDLKLGYQFMGTGWYVGGAYTTNSYKTKNPNGTATDGSLTAYGVSLGYLYEGLSIIGTYHLSSEYQVSSGTIYQGGSGYQADLGYQFALGSSVSLGPVVSYKSFEYAKLNSGGTTTDLTTKYKRGEITPYIALYFHF